MRLEKTGIGLQPLQEIKHTQTKKSKQQMVKDHDHKEHEEIISKEKVKTVVSKMNEVIEPLRTNLKFEFHEELNEYYVTVVNPITNETIKEIPPREMLDMFAEMIELMGILVDEKA